MNPVLSRRELFALLGFLALVGAWFMLPDIHQPQAYHAFANTRTWLGIPNAADTLSNLAFTAVGLLGLWYLPRFAQVTGPGIVTRRCLRVIFPGFLFTGFGSAWYHLSPDDSRLLWDRLPMTIVFAGVAGAIFSRRVSERSGTFALAFLLVAGPASLAWWQATGDLSMYGVVQFGTLALLLGVLIAARSADDPFPWWPLLGSYVLAKILENADTYIWRATDGIVSGHTLKHLAAATGGWLLARAVARWAESARALPRA
jgi:hypothetical protein